MKNILVTLIILNLMLLSTMLYGQRKTIRLDSVEQPIPYVNKYLAYDHKKQDTTYFVRQFVYGYENSDTINWDGVKKKYGIVENPKFKGCLLYTSPSPRDS